VEEELPNLNIEIGLLGYNLLTPQKCSKITKQFAIKIRPLNQECNY